MREKKLFIIAILVIGLIVLSGAGLFAQTSGSIVLQGSVPAILSVTVTTDASASGLDLSTDVTDLKVGTVVEKSNKLAGYTVTMESANAAASSSDAPYFVSSVDPVTNTDTLTYSVTYGGAAVTLAGGSATVSDQTTKTAAAGTSNEIRISYSGAAAFMYADDYTDTLTFTITAK